MSVPVAVSTAPIVAMTVVASAVVTPTVVAAAVVSGAVVVEPGPNANKNPTDEVVRTVIAVRSTGIRIVRIVAILAVGRWPKIVVIGITWSDLNSSRNLRGCCRCYQKQSTQ